MKASTSELSVTMIRRLQRQLSAECIDLIDWPRFSLEGVVAAVAARVEARIHLRPFHWEENGYSGLTLGWSGHAGTTFLVLFEEDATDEHRLVIILHELMHILLCHCSTHLVPRELRDALVSLGLLTDVTQGAFYTRMCRPGVGDSSIHGADDEMAAELGALWIITRARQAGGLPPAGQTFTAEQVAITTLLGNIEVG